MRSSTVALLAGLLPVFAVNAALLINIDAGLVACFPYLEGCYSVSRAVRSGPGLLLFKFLAIPSAAMMVWYWLRSRSWQDTWPELNQASGRWRIRLGVAGAFFFLVYAMFLGSEGEIYRWMRRYGVVFYFAFTALAQLFLCSELWKHRNHLANGRLRGQVLGYLLVVSVMWILGIASAFKRKLIDNPEFLDRVENALEWDFALFLCLAFVALAVLHRKSEQLEPCRKRSGTVV